MTDTSIKSFDRKFMLDVVAVILAVASPFVWVLAGGFGGLIGVVIVILGAIFMLIAATINRGEDGSLVRKKTGKWLKRASLIVLIVSAVLLLATVVVGIGGERRIFFLRHDGWTWFFYVFVFAFIPVWFCRAWIMPDNKRRIKRGWMIPFPIIYILLILLLASVIFPTSIMWRTGETRKYNAYPLKDNSGRIVVEELVTASKPYGSFWDGEERYTYDFLVESPVTIREIKDSDSISYSVIDYEHPLWKQYDGSIGL